MTFLNPAMLWAFALLAAPVILHLMKRPQAPAKPFPSLRFLTHTPLPQTGKRRLRDLLPLLLRLALFSLIILFFAAPERVLPETEPNQLSTTLFVGLDCSASMQTGTRFKQMLEQAEALLKENEFKKIYIKRLPGDSIATTSVSKARDFIHTTEPTFFAGSPDQELKYLTSLNLPENTQIHLFSDFQHEAWSHQSWPSLPMKSPVRLHALNSQAVNNCGISNVELKAHALNDYTLSATIHNYGAATAQTQLTLKNGDLNLNRALTIKPGQSFLATERFQSQLPTLSLYLSKDDYALDNRRELFLTAPASVPVGLVVSNRPQSHEEAFFLNKALSVEVPEAGHQFNTFPVDPAQISTSDAPILIFPALSDEFSQSGYQQLATWINEGGLLLATLQPGQTHPLAGFNQAGLGPIQFSGRYKSHLSFSRDFIQHLKTPQRLPLLGEALKDSTGLGLPIHDFIKIKAPTASVLIESVNGEPLVIEQMHGKGRLILFTFPLSPSYSRLPISTYFVPLIHELLKPAAETIKRPVTVEYCTFNSPFIQPGLNTNEFGQMTEIIVDPAESSNHYLTTANLKHKLEGAQKSKNFVKKDVISADLRPFLLPFLLLLLFLELGYALWRDNRQMRAERHS